MADQDSVTKEFPILYCRLNQTHTQEATNFVMITVLTELTAKHA